ncbi:MAG TPA: hypothetical protein VGI74_02260 [Streptosporangiaceae bacterium]|jgi:hypothetical protein
MTQSMPDEAPEILDGPSLLPQKSWLGHPMALAAGGGAVVLLVIVVILFATGVFRSPGTISVHGTEIVIADPFNGQSVQEVYPDVADGTRVTVVNPAGTAIATGTLRTDPAGMERALKIAVSGTPLVPAADFASFVAEYDFTATVPAGLVRYGVRVGLGRHTAWFTEQQMRHGPELTLGSLGG